MSVKNLARILLLAVFIIVMSVPVFGQGTTTIKILSLSFIQADWDVIISEFQQDHPDINIELEELAFNDLFQQIQVRLAAGGPDPDVYSVDVPLTASYAARGWLLPLDDVFTEEDIADWVPSSYEAGLVNGQLMSAPVSTSTQVLYINLDAFEAAGIEPPGVDDRWTWEQVAEAAQALTLDADGDGVPEVWGFAWEQFIRIYQLQPLPASLGAPAIGEDGLTVDGIINSEEWVQAFSFYADMYNALGVAPQADANFWPPDIFETGRIAMMVAGPWNIRRFTDSVTDFEWSVSRHPYFEDGEVVTPTGSWHLGVNPNSTRQEAAKTFVRWLTTGRGAELWWREGSGDFPAQLSVLQMFADEPEFDELPMSFMRVAADEATQGPVPRPVTVGYLEYEQILQDTFLDIVNGADVETALNIAVERIENEMRKYRR